MAMRVIRSRSGLSLSEKQALSGTVFKSMSKDPRDKMTAYVTLNIMLDKLANGDRAAARRLQTAIGAALGVEGFVRMHGTILTRDRGLRTAAARLFCRLLNLNVANQKLADSIAIGGGNLNGVRLVAVGSAYQEAFKRAHEEAPASPASSDGGSPTPHDADEFRRHLEDLTADTVAAVEAVGGEEESAPPQLGFWSHVLQAKDDGEAAAVLGVFPDPVVAAVGYYAAPSKPKSAHRRSGQSLPRPSSATPYIPRPRTAPPASPVTVGASHAWEAPSGRSSPAVGSPLSRPGDAVATPGRSPQRHQLVKEVAALQRKCRRLQQGGPRNTGRLSMSFGDSMASPRKGDASVAQELESTQQALAQRAEALAALDARLAPVDAGGLVSAIEAERIAEEQRRVEHQRRVERARKEDDSLHLARLKEIEKKDAADKARRAYQAKWLADERASARAKAVEAQRKTEARLKREADRAYARQVKYERKAVAKERQRKAEQAARERAVAAERRAREQERRERVMRWAALQQQAAEAKHRAVAEAKLDQVIDNPTERKLRAKAYGRLVTRRNMERMAVATPSAPPRWRKKARPESAPVRHRRMQVYTQ